MKTLTHTAGALKMAEIIAEEVIVSSAADGLQLLGNLYYQGFDGIIIHLHQITPGFFDLKKGMAGEILQKFSNYRMPLAIIGDFSIFQSKNLKDFILESNKQGQIIFVSTVAMAMDTMMRNR